jgi:hypothetical protein
VAHLPVAEQEYIGRQMLESVEKFCDRREDIDAGVEALEREPDLE